MKSYDCQVMFGDERGSQINRLAEAATGGPCPCKAGHPCPLAAGERQMLLTITPRV